MDREIEYRPLRAPREDGQALIDPPLASAGELLAANAARRAARDYDLQGRPLAEVAREGRLELLRRATRYTGQYRATPEADRAEADLPRLVLAGHQPQLFHPGVWFKNFVLSSLAQAHGAVAVNLLIDSDTIKTASIRAPSGSIRQPTLETIPFDRPGDEIPFEQRRIEDAELFRRFGDEAKRAIAPFVADPLVEQLWPLALERQKACDNLGQCIAQARHQLEGAWGLQTLELPQSELCRLPAFHWFAAHLLAHLPRLWEIHNAALAEYRAVHHLRSKSHPVPDLASEGDWLEAPLWMWTADRPRRRHVFARQEGDRLALSDRAGLDVTLDLTAEGTAHRAVEQLAALEARGVKLRTRALVTTMFARLVLSDLFLHGIGGAKYDQLTDQLIARFFGLRPPTFMTVTATMRLPIAHPPIAPDALREIDQTLRGLRYHPERHLELSQVPAAERAEARRLIDQKTAWIQTPKTFQNARARHVGISEANVALQPHLEPRRETLLTERAARARRLRAEAILASREYAFCLFPESGLRSRLWKLSLGQADDRGN